MRQRAEAVAKELSGGKLRIEAGKATLARTRLEVERGWSAVSEILASHGLSELSDQARAFSARMPQPRTEREQIADELLLRAHNSRATNQPKAR